ncbi:MAG: amidophosphoribosyltransferase [Bacteroidales bacterium]|jgi:amidophosphoribosyltransferase
MSELIKHECGIVLMRLLKPIDYYYKKYGTYFYALNKMHLLMEKQHNRGQDGAGMACVKLNLPPGVQYMYNIRSNDRYPIKDVFTQVFSNISTIYNNVSKEEIDSEWVKNNIPFVGEVYLGHLRYGTYGGNNIQNIHPVMRTNNWKTRNLFLAGNFNLTNIPELFSQLVQIGQYPQQTSDTVTILEKIGHFLDEENERLYQLFKSQGVNKIDATNKIIENLDILSILKNATKYWDGGYVIGGMLGHGDAFIFRDPNGIRPAFYYQDDEVVVAASERPVIQTTFNLKANQIKELLPGQVLIVKQNGNVQLDYYTKPSETPKPCSFESIYFSRGTDKDIYFERKQLGKFLAKKLLKEIDYDIKNSVFSYIPNTAIDAYYGLMNEVTNYCNEIKYQQLASLDYLNDKEKIKDILKVHPRFEKIAVKDIKLRTFITEDKERDDLVAHVYDITFGVIRNNIDNLVIIDDSIIRGTTLRQSIIKILDRLKPKQIIIGSSAPQLRYPDCYGIDMAKMDEFVAYKATLELFKEKNMMGVVEELYKKVKAIEDSEKIFEKNYIKEFYSYFTADEISDKIAEIVTPDDCKTKVKVVFQDIESLHESCKNNTGDWYFTGNYPTPGGNRVANLAFIYAYENKNKRAY